MAACRRTGMFVPFSFYGKTGPFAKFYRYYAKLTNVSADPPHKADPLSVFTDNRMQKLLMRVTGFDILKINKPKQVTQENPVYKLLTDAQLKDMQEKAICKARSKLQMPPVMPARTPIDEVLSHDPEIDGLHDNKFAVVDISYGLVDRKRPIVVREPDGVLRKASWEERDRLNQIYNPREGRQLFIPEMFNGTNLEDLLRREKFQYILDRACVQFEPDDPNYIQVCHRTYEVVNTNRHFDALRSTRHFGPFVFYLAWYRKLENLLADCLRRSRLDDAVDLVSIYHLIHPDRPSVAACKARTTQLEVLQTFVEMEMANCGELELTLQSLCEKPQQSMSTGNT